MNRTWTTLLISAWLAITAGAASAQTTQTAAEPDAIKAIAVLREQLISSFNKGDMDGLLANLDPDVVVTWQNAEVCRGPQEVRDYYNKMLKNDHPIVAKLATNPVVDGRHVFGDWAVSWGDLNDEYELSDGRKFKLNSRFTATIARRGEAWKVVAFHASVDAFDNPILGIAAQQTAIWVGSIGAAGGIALGILATLIFKRRRGRSAA